MEEVRSIDSIKASARTAAEHFHAGKLARPTNPWPPGTNAHKEWTATYYAHGNALAGNGAR
jgi:hypothetical protein